MAAPETAGEGRKQGRHRIGVVILNYNRSDLTRQCVQSVIEHTSPALDYRIVVIDNGSREEDRGELAALAAMPRVSVEYSRINLGFGGGHQYGLQFVEADYYLFLNSDCLFLDDVVGTLFAFMEATPDCALATGINLDSRGQYACNYHPAPHFAELVLGRKALKLFNPVRYPDRQRPPAAPLAVEVIKGAAMFVRAHAFLAIGGFDPAFFLYCEEEDLAWRLRHAGWSVWVVPEAHFEHEDGGSTPREVAYRREFFISFLYYLRKHYGVFESLAIRWFYVLKMLRRVRRDRNAWPLALFILRGAPSAASLRFNPGSQRVN